MPAPPPFKLQREAVLSFPMLLSPEPSKMVRIELMYYSVPGLPTL